MTLLDDIQKEYSSRGLTIVGVDLDESPETVGRYVESVGVTYPIWLDDPARVGTDRTRDLYTKIGGVGLPTTVFIDQGGVIQGSQVGELSRGVLQSRIESLLLPSP
jgi:AhpC/TSA family.